MKQLFVILLATFALSAFAADQVTSSPAPHKSDMKLAKKKDHSKDKKVDATKSPKKAEATTK
jgi:hypothetical protein